MLGRQLREDVGVWVIQGLQLACVPLGEPSFRDWASPFLSCDLLQSPVTFPGICHHPQPAQPASRKRQEDHTSSDTMAAWSDEGARATP